MILQILLLHSFYFWTGLLPLDYQQETTWQVPESAEKVENPTDPQDEDDLDYGKSLFMQHCRTCHGKSGLGDGPQAKNIDQTLADFSSEAFQSQSDGSIYYKISTGRGLMPDFSKKIHDDEDRWLIVNYVRTLSN